MYVSRTICWRDYLSHWIILALLLNINSAKMEGFISGFWTLFHWSVCLFFFCQFHNLDYSFVIGFEVGNGSSPLQRCPHIALHLGSLGHLWGPYKKKFMFSDCISIVQGLSHVWVFVTPWTAAHQASLSFAVSRSFLKLTSIVMPPNQHYYLLLLCNAGNPGLIPASGRSAGEGIGYPLQYSGLENSMDV